MYVRFLSLSSSKQTYHNGWKVEMLLDIPWMCKTVKSIFRAFTAFTIKNILPIEKFLAFIIIIALLRYFVVSNEILWRRWRYVKNKVIQNIFSLLKIFERKVKWKTELCAEC